METNHADGTRTIAEPFELTEGMYQEWLLYAKEATLLAGMRVAWLLLDILDHRKHKVTLLDGRSKLLNRHKQRWGDFLTNLGIGVAVVPPLLFLLRWHSRRSSVTWSLHAKA